MGRPTSVQIAVASGATATSWIPVDPHINPFNVAWVVNKANGGKDVTFTVQRTVHPILSQTSAIAIDTVVSGVNVSASAAVVRDGSITSPSTGVRLNITAVSGASTLNFIVLQAGISHG
jgi:hypothetical protein